MDVGSTMSENYSDTSQPRIELALESVRLLIQQKVSSYNNFSYYLQRIMR